jgi:acyl carrier protein
MKTKEVIVNVIFKSIEEFNQQNDVQLETNKDTILFGQQSTLDSMDVVHLLVTIEENINTEFNTSISIADERAMSQKNSPFKTVDTLSEYIYLLLNEQNP